ncbi:MAG: hypothetical protein KF767_14395 [Bdellovibrionaceae bacterium]|nr:hypothetical protein [Pseudobdellovibrionaceae bacterium]
MKRFWLRLSIAVISSLLCYGATIYIYEATAPKSLAGDREPVAFVVRVDNEVERRPIKRTIWQELENADPVYPGEAIRTARLGQAKLQFKGNGRTLDIEPESLIVISKDADNINLELLDGSVFVAQGDGPGGDEKLTLKSDQGAVDLSKATVSLSKTEGKSLDVQVLKGSATVEQDGVKQNLKSGDVSSLGGENTPLLKALAPRADAPVFVSAQNPSAQRFQWEGDAPGAKFELWMGSSRKSLNRIDAARPTAADELAFVVKPGVHFWKVVAVAAGTTISETPVQRLEVGALPAPSIIQPAQNEFITLQSEGLAITFQWSAPDRVSETTLEVATDSSFRKTLFSEKFKTGQNSAERILPGGKYHWRVSSFYPDEREMISAPPQQFEIWVKPPKVINIVWDIEKAMNYPVEPTANLKWNATADPDIKMWRLRLAPSETDLQNPESTNVLNFDLKETRHTTKLPGPGRWIASVEALDADGRVLSKSENRGFDLNLIPPVPAPVFLPEKGDLRADNKGDLNLRWRAPAGTKNFELKLKSSEGREISSLKSQKSSAHLEALLPGRYELEIRAIDQYGRPTTEPEARQVIVPDSSGLSAPKVKRIQVD